MRLPSPVALTASVLLNAAAIFSIERAATVQGTALAQQESFNAIQRRQQSLEPMSFEFIEAPPLQAKRKPENTNKISDRDSNAQSAVLGEGHSPKLAPSASDQLAQKQGTPGSIPSPASPEVPAVPAAAPPEEAPAEERMEEEPPAPDGLAVLPKEPETPAAQPTQDQQQPQQASKASEPRPAVTSTGRDRITTQAVTRQPSMGAQMQGEASFEALGSDAGAYIRKVKERIWQAWFPYVMSNYPRDFKTADALVSFVLDPEGNLKSVKILDSQGSALFAAFCVEAVQSSSPFGPPPREALEMWGKDEIEVKFGFHYR